MAPNHNAQLWYIVYNFTRPLTDNFYRFKYLDSRSTQTPGTRSLGGYWGDTDSKDVEELTLKVHGISHVGKSVVH